MHLSENEGIEGKTFVVTGGLGYVGASLCFELVRRGARQVRSFDNRSSSPFSSDLLTHGVQCIQGDVTHKEDVLKALRGSDCVFHIASYGMSGKEMIRYGVVDDVNINGTSHVLEACIEYGIKRLVYVSTYNVVFCGNEILNGNETLPYFPIESHVDPYSRSKSIAEQLVLKSNGRPFKKKDGNLYTAAIRPAAIYGPQEEKHIPRLVTVSKWGLLPFTIGDENTKSDWVYVDNLVLSLILASMGLLDDIPGRSKQPVAAGQAYFISDGFPVNSFTFLGQLLKSLDYDMPKRSVSLPFALFLSKIFLVIYSALYPLLDRWWLPPPLMLPAEVYKVGVNHYCSFLKAKAELGYFPMVSSQEGMAATIAYWQEKKRRSLDGPKIHVWLLVIIGMISTFAAAYLPDNGIVSPLRRISLLIFRTITVVRWVFITALGLHIGEGIYAWKLAKKVDPANARGWFWQTSLLGIFSLQYLLKRAKASKNE
ncbi:short-chain dehydrogenase/reductase family 42E member 1 [Impatiens glandulifera]|uniref:short-chain dehydrogenase/reductase family 42E member 1 n=1 Tax=Impatiens glandulifera TaxID=253017 RepID=UPI001FB0B82D|nr:short-chain dehydrogenase/reductase family 42E member 1 [Impatiens glandulifera]